MTVEHFGKTKEGEAVERITLRAHGLTAKVMTWGSVLQDLRLEGHDAPLVLGFEHFEDYPAHSPYFGANVGRVINRLRHGQFLINGKRYRGDCNLDGKHMLHGGSMGIGKRNWALVEHSDSHAVFSILDPDGWMGFPGNCEIKATYQLLEKATLSLILQAETDAPTVCNLGHHSYFNLDDSDTVLDHEVQLFADHYLPLDSDFVPTGETLAVAATDFDFRERRRIRNEIDGTQFIYDNNFCTADARRDLAKIASVWSTTSGVSMDVYSTEPGVQFYIGSNMEPSVPGLTGKPEGRFRGLCLEAQMWPDAPNHPSFPSIALNPGETLEQETRFRFSKA